MNISDYIAERSIPEPNSGCHLWLLSADKDGYGYAHWEGRPRRAHVLAWEGDRGPIPKGLCVCHKCDNPGCVNVDHLWVGTNEQNTGDRVRKGRSNADRGEDQYASRLTAAQVLEIRASNEAGVVLGRHYGVSHKTISGIRRGKSWKHIDTAVTAPMGAARGERAGKAKLSAAAVRAIRASTESLSAAAARYGVAAANISQIRHRKTWRHV